MYPLYPSGRSNDARADPELRGEIRRKLRARYPEVRGWVFAAVRASNPEWDGAVSLIGISDAARRLQEQVVPIRRDIFDLFNESWPSFVLAGEIPVCFRTLKEVCEWPEEVLAEALDGNDDDDDDDDGDNEDAMTDMAVFLLPEPTNRLPPLSGKAIGESLGLSGAALERFASTVPHASNFGIRADLSEISDMLAFAGLATRVDPVNPRKLATASGTRLNFQDHSGFLGYLAFLYEIQASQPSCTLPPLDGMSAENIRTSCGRFIQWWKQEFPETRYTFSTTSGKIIVCLWTSTDDGHSEEYLCYDPLDLQRPRVAELLQYRLMDILEVCGRAVTPRQAVVNIPNWASISMLPEKKDFGIREIGALYNALAVR